MGGDGRRGRAGNAVLVGPGGTRACLGKRCSGAVGSLVRTAQHLEAVLGVPPLGMSMGRQPSVMTGAQPSVRSPG